MKKLELKLILHFSEDVDDISQVIRNVADALDNQVHTAEGIAPEHENARTVGIEIIGHGEYDSLCFDGNLFEPTDEWEYGQEQ